MDTVEVPHVNLVVTFSDVSVLISDLYMHDTPPYLIRYCNVELYLLFYIKEAYLTLSVCLSLTNAVLLLPGYFPGFFIDFLYTWYRKSHHRAIMYKWARAGGGRAQRPVFVIKWV